MRILLLSLHVSFPLCKAMFQFWKTIIMKKSKKEACQWTFCHPISDRNENYAVFSLSIEREIVIFIIMRNFEGLGEKEKFDEPGFEATHTKRHINCWRALMACTRNAYRKIYIDHKLVGKSPRSRPITLEYRWKFRIENTIGDKMLSDD